MSTNCRRRASPDTLAVLILLFLPLVFFWPAATRQGAFYVGDVTRLFYPQVAVLAAGLREGHIPLWTPNALAGYPIFAQGEAAMAYPPHLLLYKLFPADVALNYSVIFSFVVAGLGMYAWLRVLRVRPGAALLGAITFAFSGFLVVRANHISMITRIPWLPVVFAALEMALRRLRHAWGAALAGLGGSAPRVSWLAWAVLAAVAFGLQGLAGHPQPSLMTGLAALGYAAIRAVPRFVVVPGEVSYPAGRAARLAGWLAGIGVAAGSLALGGLLAAVQLLPTWELMAESQRAGGLSGSFFTSFSWHPALLATLVYPFPFGNPYPRISIELSAYLGVLPLLLAALAVWRRRPHRKPRPAAIDIHRENASTPANGTDLTSTSPRSSGPSAAFVWLVVALGIGALLLAFGAYNPAYRLLSHVPFFNLFRAPARFWYLVTFAVATLTGVGLNDLLRAVIRSQGLEANSRNGEPPERQVSNRLPLATDHWPLATLLLFFPVVLLLVNLTPDVDTLVKAWRVLPIVWIGLSLGLLWLARCGRLDAGRILVACLALVASDLYAHSAVYGRTYNALMDLPAFYSRPKALDFLPADRSSFRVYTSEEIVPAVSVQRESFYPNTSLVNGVQAAGAYLPLYPRYPLDFLTGLNGRRLDLLNVRYVVIPQLLATDEASERYDVEDPFAPSLVGRSVSIPPVEIASASVASYTSHSADWPQGSPVADIVLTASDGTTVTLSLRAGIETAEWAYDRPDVREHIAHERPPVARTWEASSGFPPQPHPGHSFLARFSLDRPITVTAVTIRAYRPLAYVRLEDVELVSPDGRSRSLDWLLGRPDHRLVYRSQDAVIYENEDALPRAYLVGRARHIDDAEALRLVDSGAFDPRAEVLLADVEPSPASTDPAGRADIEVYRPEHVRIRAEAGHDAYLVLLDAYYPGWKATVDGAPVPILRANTMFRAVRVPRGGHVVEFDYRPASVWLGAWISSLASLAAAGTLIAALWSRRR